MTSRTRKYFIRKKRLQAEENISIAKGVLNVKLNGIAASMEFRNTYIIQGSRGDRPAKDS